MIATFRLVAVGLAAIALAGCMADQRPRTPRKMIDRALSSAAYTAQPSLIVAREIAFERAAREDGQWTAFREFAAPDALLHTRTGPVPALPLLAQLDDPPKAVQWSPRTVMMSCDGQMAVSRGRFLDPDGKVGTFVTVWTRQGNEDDYRWAYDSGGDDDPQPKPVERDPNEIVATAYDAVQGLVADCPTASDPVPPPPALPDAGTARRGVQLSPDGTLRWLWEHREDGTRYVRGDYFTSGAWEKVVEETFAPPAE